MLLARRSNVVKVRVAKARENPFLTFLRRGYVDKMSYKIDKFTFPYVASEKLVVIIVREKIHLLLESCTRSKYE